MVSASRQAPPFGIGASPDLSQMQRRLEGALRRREREVAAAARSGGAADGTAREQGPRGRGAAGAGVDHVVPRAVELHERVAIHDRYGGPEVFRHAPAHLRVEERAGREARLHAMSQIAAFGNTFDLDLYTIDVATFGQPSDIDANCRVIVLLSPIINKLTKASDCTTLGYIAGFFNAVDLLPAQYPGKSNGAEIFYSLVPDPRRHVELHAHGRAGGAADAFDVHSRVPAHDLLRAARDHSGGNEEDPWLNEGLSHIAEELGSRYYENRFPPPTGRTDPDQAFPDSSQGFISGDLYNSYHYLLNTASTDSSDKASVSNWGNGDGTLVQRGAAWLFLRWLGDQQDSTVYGRLDQTATDWGAERRGGVRATLPDAVRRVLARALRGQSAGNSALHRFRPELRFTSRNLRALYGKQHERNPSNFTQTFPIEALALTPGSARNGGDESWHDGLLRVDRALEWLCARRHLRSIDRHLRCIARRAGERLPLPERGGVSVVGAEQLSRS